MKTIEDRLSELEERLRRAESALGDLGMVWIYYPGQDGNPAPEWASAKEWCVLRVPHFIEEKVHIKAAVVEKFVEWTLRAYQDHATEFDLLDYVCRIGQAAFDAWRKSKGELGRDGCPRLRSFCGSLITQRGDWGNSGPLVPWAKALLNHYGLEESKNWEVAA